MKLLVASWILDISDNLTSVLQQFQVQLVTWVSFAITQILITLSGATPCKHDHMVVM